MNARQKNLQRMLHPRHIVFIGGSSVIRQGIENSKNIGFDGEIYAVSKSVSLLPDVYFYDNLQALPIVPDAAFVAVRGETAVDIVQELKHMGVYGCVLYSAGFSEIGNRALYERLVEAAGDMAMMGPNCYGAINFLDGVPLWPDRFGVQTAEEGAAIISQSGNLTFNMTLNNRSLPLGYVFSVGNQTVLDIADYLLVAAADSRVKAIGLHIEGLSDVEKFMKAAKTVLDRGIPIVAFKTGTSEVGGKLTLSHTSSLAGSDDLYDALFKRLNMVRVYSLADFLETLKLFSVTGTIKGKNLGILTVSGGESAIAADSAAGKGFQLPELEQEQVVKLQKLLTKFEHISNPLDYNTSIWGEETKLYQCFTAFVQGPFDMHLLVLDYLDVEDTYIRDWTIAVQAFAKAASEQGVNAAVISVLPEGMPALLRELLITYGITPLQGMSEAFIALEAVTSYTTKKEAINVISTDLMLPDKVVDREHLMVLDEWRGKQELHSHGLTIPFGEIISFNEEYLIQTEMSGPFVIKGVSDKIAHKTDIGAVKLNLHTEKEIRQTMLQMYDELVDQLDGKMQFLLEKMVLNTVAELNLGIKRDRQFGLILIISMGGELVNLVHDSVPVILPTNRQEVTRALYSLKGIALLQGFRGRLKGDADAVIEAALSVAEYAEANKNTLMEMDINPLLVLPEGQGAVAVDAFIRKTAENQQQEESSPVINVPPSL